MNRCKQTWDGMECPYEGRVYLIPLGGAYTDAFHYDNIIPYKQIEEKKYYYLKDIRFSFVKFVKIIAKTEDTITLKTLFHKNTDAHEPWLRTSPYEENEEEDLSDFQDNTLQLYRAFDRTPTIVGGKRHRKTKRTRRSKRRTHRK
jgi:hypothetical protein